MRNHLRGEVSALIIPDRIPTFLPNSNVLAAERAYQIHDGPPFRLN